MMLPLPLCQAPYRCVIIPWNGVTQYMLHAVCHFRYDSGQAIQNPIAGTTEESTAVDDEQLYDAPVYAAQQEPAADDEDDDSGEEYDAPAQPAGDGGYLDVNEDDTQNG